MYLAMSRMKETLVNFFYQDRTGKTNLCWKRHGVSDSGHTSIMPERLTSQTLQKL